MKQIKISIFLLALLGYGLFAQQPGGPPGSMGGPTETFKQTVTVSKVIETEYAESKRFTGRVASPAIVQIYARVSGELLEVGFKDGGVVKKGQVLYRLDPIRYQATVKSAEAKLMGDRASLDYSEKDYERNTSLYERNLISKESLEKVLNSRDLAKASVQSSEAELILAQDDLDHTIITSPLDGRIGITTYTPGNYITPGGLVSVLQTNPMRVFFSISNRDLLSIFGSQKNLMETAKITVRLADNSLYPEEGELELINNEANSKTDSVQISALFENPRETLISGSVLTIQLSKRLSEKAIAISPSAIMHDSIGSYVYVLDQANKIEKRSIVLGATGTDLQIIKAGLTPGEVVVIDGTHKASVGEEIEPIYQKE